MTKHTAAPWHIGAPPPNGEQAIGAQNGMMVAIATTGVGMKEETLANARLIAAAPELLEALKQLEIVAHDDAVWLTMRANVKNKVGAGSIRLEGVYADDMKKRFEIINAAIAKAEEQA